MLGVLVVATALGTAVGVSVFAGNETAVAIERCLHFVITASGSRGSVATLRPRPFVDCNPL